MTHRVWDPAPAAQISPVGFAAAIPTSYNTLPWNHIDRITNLDHFFDYLGYIIELAAEQVEIQGPPGLAYMLAIEPAITHVVLAFEVFGQRWDVISVSSPSCATTGNFANCPRTGSHTTCNFCSRWRYRYDGNRECQRRRHF